MRCHICNAPLSNQEIIFNPKYGRYEPCYTCLEIALDAAGFNKPDEDIEEEESLDDFLVNYDEAEDFSNYDDNNENDYEHF